MLRSVNSGQAIKLKRGHGRVVMVNLTVNKATASINKCSYHEIPLGVKDGARDVAGPSRLHLLPSKPQKYANCSQGEAISLVLKICQHFFSLFISKLLAQIGI